MADLIAFHGFTQTGAMFDELADLLAMEIVAPDLKGDLDAVLDGAVALLQRGGPLPLLGYSMGGRIALSLALDHPDLVSLLVLVSSGPGLAGEAERAERRSADAALAARLREIGVEQFVDEWLAQPMFHGLGFRGPEWCSADRARRLENTADDLFACLERFGQGAMPYLGNRLGELVMPVVTVVGERDEKYRAIGVELVQAVPDGHTVVAPEAGHNVLVEAPCSIVNAVLGFGWDE